MDGDSSKRRGPEIGISRTNLPPYCLSHPCSWVKIWRKIWDGRDFEGKSRGLSIEASQMEWLRFVGVLIKGVLLIGCSNI